MGVLPVDIQLGNGDMSASWLWTVVKPTRMSEKRVSWQQHFGAGQGHRLIHSSLWADVPLSRSVCCRAPSGRRRPSHTGNKHGLGGSPWPLGGGGSSTKGHDAEGGIFASTSISCTGVTAYFIKYMCQMNVVIYILAIPSPLSLRQNGSQWMGRNSWIDL